MHALILVDLQNDFMPGGALAVPNADEVIDVVNDLQSRFELVVATQDWHPADHASFADNHAGHSVGDTIDLNGLEQVLWPVHCVAETRGAEFVAALDMGRIEEVFRKGTDSFIDSYSGFFDNGHLKSTGLGDRLETRGVDTVYIAGVATDYCVKFTALDARQLNFETYLIEDACRGVELQPGDVASAVDELRAAGVHIVSSGAVGGA